MKIFQINTVVNSGSTGRIAEDIGAMALAAGHQSIIAAAKTGQTSRSQVIQIGSELDRAWHFIMSRVLDRHGFSSTQATKQLITRIAELDPDVIHLHNLHGYYLNIEVFFSYLIAVQKPVVWTFHDCWPFTGHCSYFDRVNCFKWRTECNSCPNRKGYPTSWFVDNSSRNYRDKMRLFTSLERLHIVTPSRWLAGHVKESFLNTYPVETIHNGIDLEQFRPTSTDEIKIKYRLLGKKIILGVASTWDRRKGLEDFVKLSSIIDSHMVIVLVGLNNKQQQDLPKGIIGIARTENTEELAALYSAADVLVNPTWVDNFPTTNIEALACGTPVITYNTGGSPESVDTNTGRVTAKGDVAELLAAINDILAHGKDSYTSLCRSRAKRLYNNKDRYADYLGLYGELVKEKKGISR